MASANAINRAVRHADELNLKRSNFQLAPRDDFAQVSLIEQPMFFETLVDKCQREARAINWRVQFAQM